MICNPTGVVPPDYVGQMFLDQFNELYYQCRGRTSNDWALVTPKEMLGSFVKIFDYFLGPIGTEPQNPTQWNKDAMATMETMKIDGVAMYKALAWETADGTNVAMVRLRIFRPQGLSIFFGFAEEPKPYAMPFGKGFHIEDHQMWFSTAPIRDVEAGVMALRIEAKEDYLKGFIGDEMVALSPAEPGTPVIAVLNKRPGPRVVADGYGDVLQRRMPK